MSEGGGKRDRAATVMAHGLSECRRGVAWLKVQSLFKKGKPGYGERHKEEDLVATFLLALSAEGVQKKAGVKMLDMNTDESSSEVRLQCRTDKTIRQRNSRSALTTGGPRIILGLRILGCEASPPGKKSTIRSE